MEGWLDECCRGGSQCVYACVAGCPSRKLGVCGEKIVMH